MTKNQKRLAVAFAMVYFIYDWFAGPVMDAVVHGLVGLAACLCLYAGLYALRAR